MWRRLRRRTFAPRRALLEPDHVPLVLLTALAVVGGVVAVVLALR